MAAEYAIESNHVKARDSWFIQGAWGLHEWACQPYFALVTIFLFAPYFTTHVVGDPVQGQAVWGYAQAMAGLIVAVSAPFLGAMADAAGARKPWIIFSAVLAAIGCLILWAAVPGASVLLVVGALILASAGIESLFVFANAMLPAIASTRRIGLVSGLAIAAGQLAGVVALLLVLVAFALPGSVDSPFVPETPLFGLDATTFETDRIVGPVAALWLLVFLLPLLLFVPDGRRSGLRPSEIVWRGAGQLIRTVREVRRIGNVALYLAARLVFYSGMNAGILFVGVLAAGLFSWGLVELTIYGLLASVFAALGALAGGIADKHLGSRRTLIGALMLAAIAFCLILSFSADRVLFFIEVSAAGHGPAFSSLPERGFLICVALFSLTVGAVIAASRTMMARLAPMENMAEFFGLHALIRQGTTFIAPLLVGLLTAWSGSQRFGLAVAIPLMIAGAIMLLAVREERAPATA